VPEFRGRCRFRKINKPKGDAALCFSCGDGKYAQEVNGLLMNQYLGVAQFHPVIWVLEDITGDTPRSMGVSGWRLQTCPVPSVKDPLNEIYVHLIGLNEAYRKTWLPDGTRLGSILLDRTLRQIGADERGQAMPTVWAYVSQHNTKSHRMFGDRGFAYYPSPSAGDAVRWRPPRLGL
jgi:hypothetical protein